MPRLSSTPCRVRRRVGWITNVTPLVVAGMLAACSPSSLVDVNPPSGIVDPGAIKTASSAMEMYDFAVTRFNARFGGDLYLYTPTNGVVREAGLFTDELLRNTRLDATGIDERTGSLNNAYLTLYQNLHQARIAVEQAREALRTYAPKSPPALQGQLQALEAYTVVLFGELFCSGIPLTSVPLSDPPRPTRGFTTDELFHTAIAMFDSAMVLAADSATFLNLARVGKGRAYLGLGLTDSARLAVHDVPTDFVYAVSFNASVDINDIGAQPSYNQVVDHEGGNGLAWSSDPRSALVPSGTVLIPGKYSATTGTIDITTSQPTAPIRLADGLEARLIEAEAALVAQDPSWLTTLNTLRSTCVETAACAPVPGLTTSSLPALADPGTDSLRLDLLFRERAEWLYLTAHREGDLRRLAHVYHRDPQSLWPTGVYLNPSVSTTNGTNYGVDVVMQPGTGETGNALYTGCVDTDP